LAVTALACSIVGTRPIASTPTATLPPAADVIAETASSTALGSTTASAPSSAAS
jgi:hypothetical protein